MYVFFTCIFFVIAGPQLLLINIALGDGGQMPNNRCSNCIAYNLDCTYVEAAKVRHRSLPLYSYLNFFVIVRNVALRKGESSMLTT